MLYTYNPEFHHSATFVPVNVKEMEKKEQLAHRRKFVSKKDWSYPGVSTLLQCNGHPKKPDQARTNALTEVCLWYTIYSTSNILKTSKWDGIFMNYVYIYATHSVG